MKNLLTLYPSTWVEIDLGAIRDNFCQIRRHFPNMRIIAVVKADAYGHGMKEVAQVLDKEGVDMLGVSNVSEGILLRGQGIRRPILIFESLLSPSEEMIVKYRLIPSICTLEFARRLNRHAQRKHTLVDVHVKVDTGMGRLGVWHEEAVEFIRKVASLKNLRLRGLYTHFPSADCDKAFTRKQLKDLSKLLRRLQKEDISMPYVHAANSMGILGYSSYPNLARPGLMLYGLSPKLGAHWQVVLRPALSVKSRITFLKKIPQGRSVSYGRTFVAPRSMGIATIPVGYNDGYLRCLSNKAYCLVGGQFCRVVGRVTMDQLMIDVTSVEGVRLGMEVVLLGSQGKSRISADDLARWAGTINYEIVCSLGNRLPRVYKK